MGVNKYLKQVGKLFDSEAKKCDKKKKCMRRALAKLKERERSLKAKLKHAGSAKQRKKLEGELKVVYLQRCKGVKILKELGRN